MTITFVDVASTPADNSTQVGPSVTVDKDAGGLANAQAGDLIAALVQYRDSGLQVELMPGSLQTAAGQTWSVYQFAIGNNQILSLMTCRFNGTWTADPVFSEMIGGTNPMTALALVARPTSPGKIWQPNVWPVTGTFSAPSTPFTVTINGVTTSTIFGSSSHIVIAAVASNDDNTYNTLTGSGWSQAGLPAQVRNTSGSQQSLAVAYKIQTSSGASGNVSLNQATLGGDAGVTLIMAFTEVDEPSGGGGGSTGFINSDIVENPGSGGTTIDLTLSQAVASGDGIGGALHWETTNSGRLVGIVDNQSNRYYVAQVAYEKNFEQIAVSFWRPNITNAPTSITATLTANGLWSGMAVVESDKMYRLDKHAGNLWLSADTSNPETISTAAVTPSQDGSMFVGWSSDTGAPEDEPPWYTTQSPWTKRDSTGSTGTATNVQAIFSHLQSTAAAQAFSVRNALGRDSYAFVMAFAPSSGAAAPSNVYALTSDLYQ